jgi:hypothetical protein
LVRFNRGKLEGGPVIMSEEKAGAFRIKRYPVPLLVIFLGILLSITGFVVLRGWDRERIRTQFESDAEDRYKSIKREIDPSLHVPQKRVLITWPIINFELLNRIFVDKDLKGCE